MYSISKSTVMAEEEAENKECNRIMSGVEERAQDFKIVEHK
jgi:hypothetical protein